MIEFPKHTASMHITHNDHKSNYQSLDEYLTDNSELFTLESEEARARAVATDEIWVLQWYPDSPVGFCIVAAPTFEEALRLANN